MEEDEEDIYEDTKSSASLPNKEYLSLSKLTIYHSAEDLQPDIEDMGVSEDSKLVNAETYPVERKKPSVTFEDTAKPLDFVLVWKEQTVKESGSPGSAVAEKKRSVFERNLEHEGLHLERENNDKLHFIKIYAPREVLCRYAEILKLRLPMKNIPGQDEHEPSFDLMEEVKSFLQRLLNFVKVDPKIFVPRPYRLTAEFSRDKNYLFDVDADDFFSPSVRTLVVDFILQRQRFEEKDSIFGFGIQRLISDGVYSAAYPLHDGDYKRGNNLRSVLYREWASVRKWIMYQPIHHIKDYFGVRFGLYFAWLGFYTHMLIPAALLGLICFIYGLCNLYNNTLSEDICREDQNILMCPQCDRTCDYWKLRDSCLYARITYLFDNSFTVIFAFFMSFWGTVFLELWKRYSADITHQWGLTGFDLQAEHPRPEYLARLAHAKTYKMNVVTKIEEPYVPFWKVRVPATILSFSVVLLLISTAVGAVFGVVLYRMSQVAAFSFTNKVDETSYMIMFIPITAALINLVCIMLLNYVYDWLAVRLTELELLRTQTEFEDSLTLKIYLFQFVNYYTSIFYIAFLKGKFVGYPCKYNRIFSYRQEECNPGGCLMELCIQLAIIMVGKQAMNSILEMVIPFLYKWYNTIRLKIGLVKEEEELKCYNQWTEDYKLLDWGPRGLFPEYLEMVLQYGFVTIFVAAFPLAPFFALLNNVLEMRLDAKKFLQFYRRPVPHRVKSIGIWFRILDVVGRISVITNAFIIAFSSNFIPRLVYVMTQSGNHTDAGFLEFSLSYFNVSDFEPKYAPVNSRYPNITECRYAEYRNPYWHEKKYKRPLIYWHILAARLAFVVVFQNVVGLVMMAVQWLIPDMSRRLRDDIRREAYLTNEIIIKQETLRARGFSSASTEDFIASERTEEDRQMSHGNHVVRFRGDNESVSIEEV